MSHSNEYGITLSSFFFFFFLLLMVIYFQMLYSAENDFLLKTHLVPFDISSEHNRPIRDIIVYANVRFRPAVDCNFISFS